MTFDITIETSCPGYTTARQTHSLYRPLYWLPSKRLAARLVLRERLQYIEAREPLSGLEWQQRMVRQTIYATAEGRRRRKRRVALFDLVRFVRKDVRIGRSLSILRTCESSQTNRSRR
jgi:hypothetical protein